MRILYIFRSLAVWGGIERVLVEKMNNLVSMYGYDVYMLTTGQGEHPVPYHLEPSVHLEDLGIQFHKKYRYRGLRRLWDGYQRRKLFEKRLSERLSVIQPDIIVCTTADPVNSIAKVKGNIPLVVESHSICSRTFGEKGLMQRYVACLLRRGLRKASCVVAMTEDDAADWRKYHPHVRVIPDIVHLSDGPMSTLTEKRAIFVGRFDYQKRPLEAIRIWQQVFPQFPDWHLDVYGEGEQLQALQAQADMLRMNIHIHKPTDKIFDCYRQSSILISTSLFEPFGLVIPEAMSCGVPVIAYDCPFGPAFFIKDNENGFLIPYNDGEVYAERLKQLMSDESLRRKFVESAVGLASAYSAEVIMPKWKHLFEAVVSHASQ